MAEMQLQRTVSVTMRNTTSDNLTFHRYYNLDGNPNAKFPSTIPAGGTVYQNDTVSKGAVVYIGRNKDQVFCSWLLAWDTPRSNANPPAWKVYVTCGSKVEIDKLTSRDILRNLATASSFSDYNEMNTYTTVYARALASVPNDSVQVSATFGLIPQN